MKKNYIAPLLEIEKISMEVSLATTSYTGNSVDLTIEEDETADFWTL